MSTAGSPSGASAAAIAGGVKRRQVALQVDDDLGAALRIDLAERLEDAVGTRGMVGPRQHCTPAGLLHGRGNRRGIGRDHDRTDFGLLRAAQDLDDHRRAADVGERLAWQPGRGHAGGNQNQDISHRGAQPSKDPAYTGCNRRGKPAICAPPTARGASSDELVRTQ